jgi:hypothetical protein
MRFSFDQLSRHQLSAGRILSSSFTFPLEFYPAIPTRSLPCRHLHGHHFHDRVLSWALLPFSTSGNSRSTLREPAQPATVRLQGLITLLTAYALEIRASFISHRQRSWDSPFGGTFPCRLPKFITSAEPTYRFTRRFFGCERTRPARRASISGSVPHGIAG